MIIPNLLGAWVVIVACIWLIKVVIFHDLLFVFPLTAYFYFIMKLDEYTKKYQKLLTEKALSESLTKTTEIIDKTSSFSQTATYLTSYFVSHPASDSNLFQTLHESFMRQHRKEYQHMKSISYFKPILDTIVEVKETLEEFQGTFLYPPPSRSFLKRHRRKHRCKRNRFRFKPTLDTVQEVSNEYYVTETTV
ncbi:hypothetical protein NPIL_200731 [Nephila pilipes]|uniref:Uncharacterized protein n=1 Tax=Nephila pilipes TaxID=299642 RepID=A0A8X6NG04_NEPPI|nr:hypothetical protein NPIL_200731 [Nephila pilipes]